MRPAPLRRVASGALFVAVGSVLTAAPFAQAASVQLDGTIRDFKGSFTSTSPFTPVSGGHPHFEIFTVDPSNPLGPSRIPAPYGGIFGLQAQIGVVEPGIVTDTIGADRKPVWQGGTNPALFATTKTKVNASNDNLEPNADDAQNRANFDQWFNDASGINQSTPFSLTLDDADSDGVYTYQNDAFFPIDGQLFGNEGRTHNQHFTFEAHSSFTYQPGQSFTFIGDDDVWVFINDQRVIDLGGVHQQLTGTVDLDTLGLTEGEEYQFDFFFAERNTFESHFRIETSIALGDDGGEPPPPPPPPTGIPLPAAAIPGVVLLASLSGLEGVKRIRRRRRA